MVLLALAPHMDYANLDGVVEGMGASEGYLEAIRPGHDDRKKSRARSAAAMLLLDRH